MKKAFLILCIFLMLLACSIPEITKEFIKEHAKIGYSQSEIKNIFGKPVLTGKNGNVEIWMFEKTKPNFTYDQDLKHVNHKEIKNGNIDWKLYIRFFEDKVFSYQYFYLGQNGEVWSLEITPDNEIRDYQVSFTK